MTKYILQNQNSKIRERKDNFRCFKEEAVDFMTS